MNPMAVEAMGELGISMEGQAPKQLTQELADSATRIITMGCGVDATSCPARIHLSEDWGLDDPAGKRHREGPGDSRPNPGAGRGPAPRRLVEEVKR